MGKLTADLVLVSPQFTNTIKDRELDLRGLKIPVIENLGGTLDQFDTIDFTDNDIKRLDGFPRLTRLKTVLLSNNRVSKIAEDLETNVPNLQHLVLNNNELSQLGDLNPLANLKSLTSISLIQNPVNALAHYRLYLIHLCPSLHLIDFQKVKDEERKQAKQMFEGKSGKKLKGEIVKVSAAPSVVQVVKPKAPAVGPSALEVARIKTAIQQASSLQEVQALEQQLKAGTWGAPAAAAAAPTVIDAMEETED